MSKNKSYFDLYSEAVESHRGEDLTQTFYTFKNPGDMLIGKFIGEETVAPKEDMGDVQRYIFDTEIGVISCLLGSATDKQLSGKLKPGDLLAIIYNGKESIDNGKKSVNKFEVKRFGHAND